MSTYIKKWCFIALPVFILVIISSFIWQVGPSELVENSHLNSKDPVKIGFLIKSDTAKDDLSKQAVQTIYLSLKKINNSGGINGNEVQVYIKACDGPWGAGSKQSVDLIYKDDVCAMLGFVDGRNAHLAEQVATKSQVVFLSTYSPDPTLSKINIPWFFSSMYNADQQAQLLTSEIYENQNLTEVIVIASDDYDDGFLAKSFLKEVENKHFTTPTLISHRAGKGNFKQIVTQIKEDDADGIVFLGNQEDWSNFIYFLKSFNLQIPVFCPVKELDYDMASLTSIPVYMLAPGSWLGEKGKMFKEEFYKEYGYSPGISSIFTYDGMMALCEAIEKVGTDRMNIQEGLFEVEMNGISGKLSFHPSGKRLGNLKVIQLYSTRIAR